MRKKIYVKVGGEGGRVVGEREVMWKAKLEVHTAKPRYKEPYCTYVCQSFDGERGTFAHWHVPRRYDCAFEIQTPLFVGKTKQPIKVDN